MTPSILKIRKRCEAMRKSLFDLLKRIPDGIAGMLKMIPHLSPLFHDDNPQRRQFERFRTEGNSYVAFGNPFKRDGKLIDISSNGIAFKCFVEKGRLKGLFDLDIFLEDESFYLAKIPCRIVTDFELDESRTEGVRRCGAQFGELTASQKRRLEFFLKNHTKNTQHPRYYLADPFAF